MRDYSKIPCGLEFTPEDKRDYTLDLYGLGENAPESYPDEYVMPITTPVLDQGLTSMCLDFTYRSIEEEQYMQKTGGYVEFANGFLYGQKLFPKMEGMAEAFEVSNYTKKGIPLKKDFHVTGTSAECKAYFDANITSAIRANARVHRNRAYVSVKTPEEVIKGIINFRSSGYIGIEVYKNFYTIGTNGIAPYPVGPKDGGHAMKLKGVKLIDDEQYYVVQNSWGTEWGDNGYCYIKHDNPIIRQMRVFADARPEFEVMQISIADPVIKMLTKDVLMDVAPFIQNDRTYVPLRFVTEALGYKVEWHANMGTKKLGLVKIFKEV